MQEFLFPLIAMITGEPVMLLAAAGAAGIMIKFLKETSALAYQSCYMLATGKAESHVAPFCYIAFFALAALCAYLAYFFSYDILAIACLWVCV